MSFWKSLFGGEGDKHIVIEQAEELNYIIGIKHDDTNVGESSIVLDAEDDPKEFKKLPEISQIVYNHLWNKDELTIKQMTKIVDFLKEVYLNILPKINEDDLLFIPFKCNEGSTFIYKTDFDEMKSKNIAEKLLSMGATLELTILEDTINFVHANTGYLRCFQYNGKGDYLELSNLLNSGKNRGYIGVTGNFSASFQTESGENIRIDEIIFQSYDCGSLDEGWESEKVNEDGNFMPEKEVDENYVGDQAINEFFTYHCNLLEFDEKNIEIAKTWLDRDYVANNLIS